MKFYVVHDRDGTIVRTGWCQNHLVAAQAAPGETSIEGRADDRVDAVFEGVVMRKTEAPKRDP